MPRRLLAFVPAAVLLVTSTAASAAVAASWSATTAAHVRWLDGHPLPDPTATPGRAMSHAGPSKFCYAGYTSSVRHVTESTRQAVFAEYGIAWSKRSNYEVDHLIPLELGGSNVMANLWPERGSIPNAKDGLENRLHNLVCLHELSVRKARHAIATNWVKALHAYGHTGYVYERPGGSTSGTSGSGGSTGTSGHACTRTSSGACVSGGEFCPQSSYGQVGYDAQGRAWTCTGDRTHPHWE